MLTLTRRYTFEAAHRLTAGVPPDHQCARLHGHRYVLTVSVAGETHEDGMLVEYAVLDELVRSRILKIVDHYDLNTLDKRDSSGRHVAENPTVEHLIEWVSYVLSKENPLTAHGARLSRLTLQEDEDSWCEWSLTDES